MDTTPIDERSARGFERFLLFSDAIAAIAITLLILPLVDAATDANNQDQSVADILRDIQWELFSFLLSFAVILTLWMNHQQVYNAVHAVTKPIVRAGMIWLLAIVFLPFTTALIADHAGEQATLVLYVANIAIAIYAMTFATWMLQRTPGLLHPGAEIDSGSMSASFRATILITLALLTAVVFPALGFWVMGLLALDRPLAKLNTYR